MSHRYIVNLTNNNFNTLTFLKTNLYLKEAINWPRCNNLMDTIVSSQSLDGFIFNCKVCRKKVSVWKNSFLEVSKITMIQFIDFINFLFESNLNINDLNHETGLSAKTIVKFNKLFREVIIERILCNSQPIGGPGIIVQIDETLVFKRKYNRGRNIQQIWIVGGISPKIKNFFLRQVPNRNSETITNVLQ